MFETNFPPDMSEKTVSCKYVAVGGSMTQTKFFLRRHFMATYHFNPILEKVSFLTNQIARKHT